MDDKSKELVNRVNEILRDGGELEVVQDELLIDVIERLVRCYPGNKREHPLYRKD